MKTVFPKNTIIRGNILQIKNSHLPCSFYLHAYVLLKCPRTNVLVCGGINPSFSLRLFTTKSLNISTAIWTGGENDSLHKLIIFENAHTSLI